MQEAMLSSRIEGTQATMGEVREFEAGKDAESPECRADTHTLPALPRTEETGHSICC